jgi:NADPH-dependent curcumin reductase
MTEKGRQLVLRRRPNGLIADGDYEVIDVDIPTLEEGQALVRTAMLSLEAGGRRMFDRMPFGVPLSCWGAGVVAESRTDRLPVGTRVAGSLSWQDFAIVGEDWMALRLPDDVDLPTALFPVGPSGMTAYAGLVLDGAPQTGQVVVVSGASGGVGSLAGQFARIRGCTVVGITGGREKASWLIDELGFDAAIDRHGPDLDKTLGEICPDGIDLFFDNVGGAMRETVTGHLRPGARLVRCGFTSEHLDPKIGSRLPSFYTMGYASFFPEATANVLGWIADSSLRCHYTMVSGLDRGPVGLNMLYTGDSKGKVLVQISDPPAERGSRAYWLWGTAGHPVGRIHPSSIWGDDARFNPRPGDFQFPTAVATLP